MVRPDTTIGLPAPEPSIAPGFEATVQPVTRSPPLAGSLKLTDASESRGVATTISGASGTVADVEGIELLEGPGAGPVLPAFVAAAGVLVVGPEAVGAFAPTCDVVSPPAFEYAVPAVALGVPVLEMEGVELLADGEKPVDARESPPVE